MSESVDGQNESNPELWFSTSAGKPLVYSWFRAFVPKEKTIVATHPWTGHNLFFVRFYIFIDLDFVSVSKNGPKKELNQYLVPSVGTVAQITYNIRNNLAKQYSPQENSILGSFISFVMTVPTDDLYPAILSSLLVKNSYRFLGNCQPTAFQSQHFASGEM